jgi:NAD(P)-dependent dehydrogenase (short-subunit alcohol dehydrogenase family)
MNILRHVAVIGASRGIGKALAEKFTEQGATVTATVRTMRGGGDRSPLLDLSDPDAGRTLEAVVERGTLDALVVNAGIFGPDHQDVLQAQRDEVADLFRTNAVAPVRLARRVMPLVRKGGVIAFMSSRTASISLNADGDMELYRASKAALNSLGRSLAIKDALPAGIGVLMLHPGWVQTEMGGSEAPVTVADSVGGLIGVIREAMDRPDCRFVDYEGHELGW